MSTTRIFYHVEEDFILPYVQLKEYLASKATFRKFSDTSCALDYYNSAPAQSGSDNLFYMFESDRGYGGPQFTCYLRNYAAFVDWLRYTAALDRYRFIRTGEIPKICILPILINPDY